MGRWATREVRIKRECIVKEKYKEGWGIQLMADYMGVNREIVRGIVEKFRKKGVLV